MEGKNTVEFWIKYYEEMQFSEECVKNILDNLEEKNKFLEDIFMSDGKYSNLFFSEEFKDAAYKESRITCLRLSAVKEFRRRKKNEKNK